jgi:WD40 repeat protein
LWTGIAIAVLLAWSLFNGSPGQMQGFINYFEKLEQQRQLAPRTVRLVKSLPIPDLHAGGVFPCGSEGIIAISGGIGGSPSVVLFDVRNNAVLGRFEKLPVSRTMGCDVSGRFLARGNYDRESSIAVRIMDAGTGEIVNEIDGPFPLIDGKNLNVAWFLVFSPMEKRLFVHYKKAGFSGVKDEHWLVAYETGSWNKLSEVKLDAKPATMVSVSSDGKLLAHVDWTRHIVIHATDTMKKVVGIHTPTLVPTAISFCTGSSDVIVVGRRKYDGPHQGMPELFIQRYSVPDGNMRQEVKTAHYDNIQNVLCNDDANVIATGGIDKTIELYNAKTGSRIDTMGDRKNRIEAIMFGDNGKTIISAGGPVNVWAVELNETRAGNAGGRQ